MTARYNGGFDEMLLFAVSIFLSAFLLFQIQPMIAKIILPWFGGSAAVWTTCMLFFQVVLLLGYGYAHWITRRLTPRRQAVVHSLLLLAAAGSLPVYPADSWKPAGGADPVAGILALLAATAGAPYFLLTTTGPLTQAWFARCYPGRSPYRLFALSNTGSMLALLSYPFVVEPLLPTRSQALIWSAAFVVFGVLCLITAWRSQAAAALAEEPLAGEAPQAPPSGSGFLWAGLAACASALLLAVTNHTTQDVAPVPFLWVIPLSLYLLSFILCFDSTRWYRRDFFLPLAAVALGSMTYALTDAAELDARAEVALLNLGMFILCMVCHGELACQKPHPRHLTGFYLMIAAGGASGGLFVGLVAPYTFNAYHELPITLLAASALIVLSHFRDAASPFHAWFRRGWVWAGVALTLSIAGSLGVTAYQTAKEYRVMVRNFYSALKTSDDSDASDPGYCRTLTHGVINHGKQLLHKERRREPTTYYGPTSGIGLAIAQANRDRPQRVGVLGLGAGVMTAYGRRGDHYRIYEINPQVLHLARTEFTFLEDCPARVDIVLGDARLSLEREPPQDYDVLLADAFSSDSVPIHLLTREAFALYFRHLKSSGILVVHISNKYLDLAPVVQQAAQALGKAAVMIDDEVEDETIFFGSTMVLLAHDAAVFERPAFARAQPLKPNPKVALWTDNFSNLLGVLK